MPLFDEMGDVRSRRLAGTVRASWRAGTVVARERVRMQPITPQKLANRYTLLECVAVGGMSEVWRARDDVLQRTVAVKILGRQLLGSSEFATRFRAEARHSASLSHAGVASVYDYGEDGARAFLVMEFVDGESLSTLLERTPIPPLTTTLSILSQTAEALHAAHSAGIIHRDVKPGNIMITPAGVIKVTDFGIAKATDAIAVTAVGLVLGTPQYMSPEQASGRAIGPASDIYSLGVVAYEALAGRRPFIESTSLALAMAHVNSVPPMLPASVPPGVRALVEQAMSKDPAQRPASAALFAADLRSQQMRVTPPPSGDSLRPTQRMPLEVDAAALRKVVVGPGAVVHSLRRFAVLAVAVAVLVSVLLIALSRRTQSTTLSSSPRASELAPIGKPPSVVSTADPTIEPSASVLLAPPVTLAPTSAAPTTKPTTSPTVVLDPQAYLGRPAADVQRELVALGFNVVEESAKGKARTGDLVIEVRPAGNLVPGSDVTLVLGRFRGDD
jgi:serine/threonine protein kinase